MALIIESMKSRVKMQIFTYNIEVADFSVRYEKCYDNVLVIEI